jgi:hypothetical protein
MVSHLSDFYLVPVMQCFKHFWQLVMWYGYVVWLCGIELLITSLECSLVWEHLLLFRCNVCEK